MKESLTRGERLLKWGFKGDVMCLFCRSCIEGIKHLEYGNKCLIVDP